MTKDEIKIGDRAEVHTDGRVLPGVVIGYEETKRIRPECSRGLWAVRLDNPSDLPEGYQGVFTFPESGSPCVRRAAPAASQHPADLKPRGVKAPLGLIPWSVVPHDLIPRGVLLAAQQCGTFPDGGRCGPLRSFTDPAEPGESIASFLLSVIMGGLRGPCTIEDVAEAFGYGAAKYAPWNWQTFTWDRAAETEYWGAICRHLLAVERGEERASDSGVRHLGHAAAGCMIWVWHENKRRAAEPAEPRRPRVGDRVRWSGVDRNGPTQGEICTVLEDDGSSHMPFKISCQRSPSIGWWCDNADRLEVIS